MDLLVKTDKKKNLDKRDSTNSNIADNNFDQSIANKSFRPRAATEAPVKRPLPPKNE